MIPRRKNNMHDGDVSRTSKRDTSFCGEMTKYWICASASLFKLAAVLASQCPLHTETWTTWDHSAGNSASVQSNMDGGNKRLEKQPESGPRSPDCRTALHISRLQDILTAAFLRDLF